MVHTQGKLTRGCVVFMKASSGLTGYGDKQCVSGVCEALGTVSLFGHNQSYHIYDIGRIVEYPIDKDSHDALLVACKKAKAIREAHRRTVIIPYTIFDKMLDKAIAEAEKE